MGTMLRTLSRVAWVSIILRLPEPPACPSLPPLDGPEHSRLSTPTGCSSVPAGHHPSQSSLLARAGLACALSLLPEVLPTQAFSGQSRPGPSIRGDNGLFCPCPWPGPHPCPWVDVPSPSPAGRCEAAPPGSGGLCMRCFSVRRVFICRFLPHTGPAARGQLWGSQLRSPSSGLQESP